MVYSVDNLFIRGECGEVQAVSEALDSSMLSRMSSRRRIGSLEGTNSLALDSSLDAGLESAFLNEIDRGAKKAGDTILDVNHVQQRQSLALVEGGQQVHVGNRPCVVARDGSKQRKADHTGSPDFPFVGSKCGKDFSPVHAPIVAVL